MRRGDVIRQKKVRHQLDAKQWIEFADKDKTKVAVMVYLGMEDLDPAGKRLDVDSALSELGYIAKEKC